jgi:hypothetical protein
MKDIDDTIRLALMEEDRELFDAYSGEQSLLDMVADSFKGRARGLVAMVFVAMLLTFALTVVSVIQFFRVESTRALIAWAAVFLVGLLGTGSLKVWYWSQLDKNSLLREMKRMELQIASLASRIEERR